MEWIEIRQLVVEISMKECGCGAKTIMRCSECGKPFCVDCYQKVIRQKNFYRTGECKDCLAEEELVRE